MEDLQRLWLSLRATPRRALALELLLLAPAAALLICVASSWAGYLCIERQVQAAAELAASAAVAGRDPGERERLARLALAQALRAPADLLIEAEETLIVQISYDASAAPIFLLRGLAPLPPSLIVRRAVAPQP